MYTMKEACAQTSMTYEALKFYCNQGLVPSVKRDKNNRRIFDDRDIAWINSLQCLKSCNMSIQEMKEYLELCLLGESSIPERKIILAKKRKELQHAMKKLQDSIDYIDRKQQFYDSVLSGQMKYTSNLIQIGGQDNSAEKTTDI